MKNQCQLLKKTQRNELLKLLQKSDELFDVTLGTWKTDPVDFELKEDMKTMCSMPYPEQKVHEDIFKKVS